MRLHHRHDALRFGLLVSLDPLASHRSCGLVDIEFIIHFLQLRDNVALDPRLSRACETLVHAGLLPEAFAQAHDMLTRLIVAARLLAPDLAVPSGAAGMALAKACGQDDIDALLHEVAEARQEVARGWRQVFDEQLEMDE